MSTETEYKEEYHDPETLRRLYHEEGLSLADIGDRYDVTSAAIRWHMKKHGIERDKAYNDPTKPPSHVLDPHGDGVGNEYEKVRAYYNGSKDTIMIHRLIAYAHGKLDFDELGDPNIIVHHKSGHGLDNRPDNLEVQTAEEHGKHHTDERYGDGGWRDKHRLQELLNKTTQRETAEILGCSPSTIRRWRKKHNLE